MPMIKRSHILSLYRQCPAISSRVFPPKIQFQIRCYLPKWNSPQQSRSPVESTSSGRPTDKQSFTVNYLISSCGLSPESAISASKLVRLKPRSLERPNLVLAILKDNGLSETLITKLINKCPSLLMCSPQKTLLPKLKYFQSIGFSGSDLAKLLSSDWRLLYRSLNKRIIPSFNSIKNVLLSTERTVAALKSHSWILQVDYSKKIGPKIDFLRELGVPHQSVCLLLAHHPGAFMAKHTDFCRIVREVEELGFDRKKTAFVQAVRVLSGKGGSLRWERSFEAYGRWGWSKDDILTALRKHPISLMLSEEKIMKHMDFLVNKMGWPSERIVQCPVVLFYSLEKRTIPRCLVIRALLSKGLLIKERLSLATVLIPPEKYFLEKFVIKYQEDIPELLSVYKGQVDFDF